MFRETLLRPCAAARCRIRVVLPLVLGLLAAGELAGGGVTPSCTSGNTLPAAVQDLAITDGIPTDFDPTANPAPQTTVHFTIMTPARCADSRFPLVLHSHGYGGKRLRTLAANGDLKPQDPHFQSIDELTQALPYHGYVVISFDQRGHGESDARARIIDPNAETQDTRALLDWAYDHAADYGIQQQNDTGIAKDLKVGTIGYSYGGGYQMPLAALDPRVDTIVPNGTWHDFLYSLLPGDSVKLAYNGLLCLLATVGGVQNTPLVQTLCNTVGIQNPGAYNIRSRADLVAAGGKSTARPRPISEDEVVQFFDSHGMNYFRRQEQAGQPWGYGETSAHLRAVPALFLQGNRDVLFNLTEGYWNQRYFKAAGGDARLLSTEGGHMNPLAGQKEGTADCGSIVGVEAVLGWFDHYLRGVDTPAYTALPRVCLSVADTVGAPDVTAVGLVLDEVPVGALSGAGAVPASRASASATVGLLASQPVFVRVATISGNDKVLAGVPTIASVTVTRGAGAATGQSTNAFVGVGIVRGGQTILVDDQVTSLGVGDHTSNRNVNEDPRVMLPAVGERLKDGDEVGLLFYPQHVQYAAILSAEGLSGSSGLVGELSGAPVPSVTSSGEPLLGLLYVNPYSIDASDIELPILIPGSYPGSRLVQ